MEERLQKILARCGAGSRRKAEEMIRNGRVAVDGAIVREMGVKLDLAEHEVTLDGRVVSLEEKKVYILLNKPKGYVTTLNDPQGRPVVTDLLKGVDFRVFPVGRLDLDTEGALILTNDGSLAQTVQHPSFEVNKTYVAQVAGSPSPEKLAELSRGIVIEGKKTFPASLKVIRAASRSTLIQITIHEGRKRQVRKMFAAIGHRVQELKRIAYGRLELGTLARGKFRYLSAKEIELIFP
ncbi:MAG: rRNA pseudouridine synthase [Desulfobulbaceae bacterium]|uniref:Pseudouridine synthase n=1 Tax=Candidatus Desulfobia pelagia TaxID=2841692 RepID=A0A8J6NG00_9BACT|nr:rRNA pseudouridine synthase [Candidatus Desulfobia pelagia]